jgi:hypothetical protein
VGVGVKKEEGRRKKEEGKKEEKGRERSRGEVDWKQSASNLRGQRTIQSL